MVLIPKKGWHSHGVYMVDDTCMRMMNPYTLKDDWSLFKVLKQL